MEEAETIQRLGHYVVSIVGAGVRRLHRVGECRFMPGQDYLHFEACGEDLPAPRLYQKVCRLCFKDGLLADGGILSDGSTDEDSVVDSDLDG
eukprot:2208648-Amphidinium_carterae.1